MLYGRYAHVEDMRVTVGDRVVRGQQICKVGNGEGIFAYHLHFDLSPTSILASQSWHCSKLNRDNLLANYIDPLDFIRKNRPSER